LCCTTFPTEKRALSILIIDSCPIPKIAILLRTNLPIEHLSVRILAADSYARSASGQRGVEIAAQVPCGYAHALKLWLMSVEAAA
jgi:hypothetical protein